METVNCIIIEDEYPARELLKGYLAAVPGWEVAAEFTNALDAVAFLASNPVDVIFLDIQLPKLSGMAFLKSLDKPPLVVMTTAYEQHAVEAFELTVFDYLLKPYPFERLLKTINRANSHFQLMGNSGTWDEIPNENEEKDAEYILVRANRSNIKLPITEILYVESQKEYVQIACEARTIKVRTGIGQLEEQLPDRGFLRVHRSFLVAIGKIESFSSRQVTVAGKRIPIGRLYQKEVGKRLADGGLF